MSNLLLANNAESTLAVAINAVATTVQVQAGDAAKFPSPVAGLDNFMVTLQKVSTGEVEIVRCTARSGANLTVVRAQEGTAALSFAQLDIVSLRMTRDVAAHLVAKALGGNRNFIRNGDFQIAQRGTSVASGGAQYTLDGVYHFGAAATISQQAFAVGQTDVPGNPLYFMRDVRAAAVATHFAFRIEQPERLSGKTVSAGFYARVSAGTFALGADLFSSGVTPAIDTVGANFTLTTAWQWCTFTETVPAMTASGVNAYLALRILDGAATARTIEIADVQLEIAGEATPFERLESEQQLAWCQRFLLKLGGFTASDPIGSGQTNTTTAARIFIPLPVPMRIPPTGLTVSNVANISVFDSTARACSAIAFAASSTVLLQANTTHAAGTAERAAILETTNVNASMLITGPEL